MSVKTLGQQLKQLRLGAGISGAELARRLNTSQPSVSRIEAGRSRVTLEYVKRFCNVLHLPEKQSSDIIQMTECFLYEFDKWGCDFDAQKKIKERERHASLVQTCCPNIIPGLLQTEAYMTAVLSMFHKDSRSLKEAVQDRMRRQRYLSNQKKSFQFIVSEAALHNRYLERSDHCQQLEHLKAFCDHPGVELRVFPFSNQLSSPIFDTFVIFDSSFVTVEVFLGEQVIWSPDEISIYEQFYNQLYVKACGGRSAQRLIDSCLEKLSVNA